jgi:HlyD family secretion protein
MKNSRAFALLAILLLMGCGNGNNSNFHASAIVEGTSVKVSAQTGGYLQQVLVEEGQVVQVGQAIAVVDTEKLGYQLEQVEANLQDLRTQRRIAAANVQRAREDFEYAKTKYNRFRDLFQKNAATQQALDDAKNAYDRVSTVRESSEQTLESFGSKEKGLEAQAKLLRRQISDAVVKAPISGTVTTRYFDAGETIAPNAPLAEIIDLCRMWAKVYVSETLLSKIKIGQSTQVQIDGAAQTLGGVVAWISAKSEFTPKNILTEESRTALVYAVKINIDNPDGVLKHGMPVSITLQPE